MSILYTYNKAHFQKYKKDQEKQNVKVISFALVELKQNSLEEILGHKQVDLNITGIVQAIDQGGSLYLVEKLFYLLDEFEDLNFVIDEKYADYALEVLGVFFSTTKSVTSGYNEAETSRKQSKSATSVKTIVNSRKDKMDKLKDHININLVGHFAFKEDLINIIQSFRFFNKKLKDHPILSIFLVGGSGLGKTEVARMLSNFLDSQSTLAKINFANYKSESSLASLIGSPPGYVDSGTESDFVKKIKRSKAGVVLVDEFEKADQAVHNFFLQLLEEGKFDDAMGEVHDLTGYIIIFTSNLNVDQYNNSLSPELKSRFDLVTHFEVLSLENKHLFARRILNDYIRRAKLQLSDKDIEILIARVNLEQENNLRNIKRKIRLQLFEYINEKDLI
ncbi:AAA family ATPase [Bacillus piscicola]|uniref:AAA family ATPase n=1 Tax=Bacillus piscicola TaxID=1632684 RepID=UPI001F09FD37|nr:AAA family ATPase [Bacillus piscicola]